MKQRWKLLVKGKVQGVYYRKSAKQKADELRLSGWVRNEHDGSVRLEVEGDEIKLKQFEDWCKVGPPSALVNEVITEATTPEDDVGFEVRRF